MSKKVKATLYISTEKREKIKRSGLSLEEYCNKIYNAYENFHMDTWNNGSFMMDYELPYSIIGKIYDKLKLEKEFTNNVDEGLETAKKIVES